MNVAYCPRCKRIVTASETWFYNRHRRRGRRCALTRTLVPARNRRQVIQLPLPGVEP